MKMIEPSENCSLTEGVKYNGEHPYIKDLVTGERHPVTANGYELNWKVWVVEDSRLWKLNQHTLIQQEPVSFENRGQQPFFVYVGISFRIPFQALSSPPMESNLEWMEYVGKKVIEYKEFLETPKGRRKRKTFCII